MIFGFSKNLCMRIPLLCSFYLYLIYKSPVLSTYNSNVAPYINFFSKLSAIYLSRGNHESKSMNKIYGFEGEVRSKLSEIFVELFAEVFCCLPLAHVINEKVFVVHGGLFSVDGVKLSDIKAIDRFCEPPEEGKLYKLNLYIPFLKLKLYLLMV